MNAAQPLARPCVLRSALAILGALLLAAPAGAQASLSSRAAISPHGTTGPVHAYAITPLGGEATAINAAGQVLVNQGTLAYLFTPSQPNGTQGQLVPLGTLGGTVSIGKGLNAAGHGTGFSTLAGGEYRAFLSGEGPLQGIGTLSGDFSSGTAINDAGQIVGFSYGADSEEHGFLWTPFVRGGSTGTMLDLGTLGGDYSEALAVNAAGDVAGYAYTPAGAFHAFVWHAAHMTDLGTLGGSYSKAFALDDHGRVVGQAYLPGNGKAHACLWANGQPAVDLGNLGGSYSAALALDVDGQHIVGEATVPGGAFLQYHAFLYAGGEMLDLNLLLQGAGGWLLQSAHAVNSAGQIVGAGLLDGLPAGFLLTPL